MKKSFKILLIVLALISLTACSKNVDEKEVSDNKEIVNINQVKPISIKKLTLELPNVYEASDEEFEENAGYIAYLAPETYDLSACDFYFEFEKIANDSLSITKEITSYLEVGDNHQITKEVINGHEWSHSERVNKSHEGNPIDGIYVSEYDGIRYFLEYNSENPSSVSCDALIKKVTSSLKFQ